MKTMTTLLGLLALGVTSVHAQLATTNVNLAPQDNGSWTASWFSSHNLGGGNNPTQLYAAGPGTGNNGTGISFGDYNGSFIDIGSETGITHDTISFGNVVLGNSTTVNALVNEFWGQANTPNAVFTFTNNLGQTATYSLIGDQTIRDYNGGAFANDLLGYNTNSSYGAVTSQDWWNNSATGGSQRLDVASFILPTSWVGTDLTSVLVTNPYGTTQYTDDIILSGLQVTTTPEPRSWMFAGLVLAAVMLLRYPGSVYGAARS